MVEVFNISVLPQAPDTSCAGWASILLQIAPFWEDFWWSEGRWWISCRAISGKSRLLFAFVFQASWGLKQGRGLFLLLSAGAEQMPAHVSAEQGAW